MDANGYFESVYFEMNFLKTKIDDIIRAIEKTPCPAKNKVAPQLPRLRFLARYLDRRKEQLWSECPTDWKAATRELERHQETPEECFFVPYPGGIAKESLYELQRCL